MWVPLYLYPTQRMPHGTPDCASPPGPPPPTQDSRGRGGPPPERPARRGGARLSAATPAPEAAEGGTMTRPAKPLALAAIPADTRCIVYTRVSTEDQAADDR